MWKSAKSQRKAKGRNLGIDRGSAGGLPSQLALGPKGRSAGPTPIPRAGQPGRERDEDANLGGAGSLERDQPISVLFDTLEYRARHPETGVFPEVHERRAEAR